MTTFRFEDIESIIREFEAGDLATLEVRVGDCSLFLARHPDARPSWSEAPAPSSDAATVGPAPRRATVAAMAEIPQPDDIDVPPGHTIVEAPSMGTFYRAEKPGSPPFVDVGSPVMPDTQVCLIEVMKLFSTVRAGVQGRIARILVADGTTITTGQPLFLVDTRD